MCFLTQRFTELHQRMGCIGACSGIGVPAGQPVGFEAPLEHRAATGLEFENPSVCTQVNSLAWRGLQLFEYRSVR